MLLLLLACDGDKPADTDTAAPADADTDTDADTDADTDTDTDTDVDTDCTDADGDGVCAPEDCDDADPSVFPAANEACDGVDQDCDGAADNGLLTDGEGCVDETPAWDDPVDTLEITLRTGSDTNDTTTENVELCVTATDCYWLDTEDWDDRENGQIDVYHVPVTLLKSQIDRVTLTTEVGDNAWDPSCVAVSADGEPLYSKDIPSTVLIGTDTNETPTYEDTPGLETLGCFSEPLTHGPLLGAVDETTATVWFRTDASRAVELRVADDVDDLGSVTPIHTSWPSPTTDFTDTVTIHGLAPGRTYSYDLTIEGVTYGPWDIHTPSPDAPVRVLFGSCSRDDDQPIFDEILDLEPDLFLFVGDNHYGNTAIPDAQRAFYRWAHERDGRAELLSRASILATWDDHDYAGDNTDGTAVGREDALSVFTSYWANPAYGTDDLPGTFYRWRYGDIEVFAVDDRYYKDLEDSTLGAAQTAWLVEALHDSTARFKVLASGTQITSDYSSDAYYAHEADRDALLTAIADVEGLILLSGDVHRSEFRLDSGVGGPIPELTSSPLANANADSSCRDDDEVLTCYDSGDSVIVLDFSPDGTVEAQLVLEDGSVEATWVVPI